MVLGGGIYATGMAKCYKSGFFSFFFCFFPGEPLVKH